MSRVHAFFRDERGATAIEYGLIAAGISVAIIATVNGLGTQLNTTFQHLDAIEITICRPIKIVEAASVRAASLFNQACDVRLWPKADTVIAAGGPQPHQLPTTASLMRRRPEHL